MNIGVYVTSNYANYDRLSKMLTTYIRKYTTSPVILTALSPSTKPDHGNNLVKRYADENHIRCKVYETEWNKWKRSAGSIVSYHMNHNSERSFVFWDGLSKGCRNYLNMTRRMRRPCDLIRVNPNDGVETSPSEQEKRELELAQAEQQKLQQQQQQQSAQQQAAQSGQSDQTTQATQAVQNSPSAETPQNGQQSQQSQNTEQQVAQNGAVQGGEQTASANTAQATEPPPTPQQQTQTVQPQSQTANMPTNAQTASSAETPADASPNSPTNSASAQTAYTNAEQETTESEHSIEQLVGDEPIEKKS